MLMIGLLILLGLSVIATSFVPIVIPFTLGLILQLLYLGVNGFLIFGIIILASLAMGIIRYEGDKKIMNYLSQHYPKVISKKIEMNDNKRGTMLSRIHNNIYLIRVCTIIASRSSLPDIIIIRIVRNKMNIYQRLSSYTLGKVIIYGIVIFPGQMLIKFL